MKTKFFLTITLILALAVGTVSASPVNFKSNTEKTFKMKEGNQMKKHHRHHRKHHHHHVMKHG